MLSPSFKVGRITLKGSPDSPLDSIVPINRINLIIYNFAVMKKGEIEPVPGRPTLAISDAVPEGAFRYPPKIFNRLNVR
jgi:hypothetical protein